MAGGIWNEKEIAAELRERVADGQPLSEILTWLGKTGAKVGEAVDLLEQNAGLTRERAEHEIAAHPDWEPLIKLMGGIAGEQL